MLKVGICNFYRLGQVHPGPPPPCAWFSLSLGLNLQLLSTLLKSRLLNTCRKRLISFLFFCNLCLFCAFLKRILGYCCTRPRRLPWSSSIALVASFKFGPGMFGACQASRETKARVQAARAFVCGSSRLCARVAGVSSAHASLALSLSHTHEHTACVRACTACVFLLHMSLPRTPALLCFFGFLLVQFRG